MDHIGIDVHKRESQICLLAEGGELIERRIRTEPERFTAVLSGRLRARIVIEASSAARKNVSSENFASRQKSSGEILNARTSNRLMYGRS